jgi:hypothetical protein
MVPSDARPGSGVLSGAGVGQVSRDRRAVGGPEGPAWGMRRGVRRAPGGALGTGSRYRTVYCRPAALQAAAYSGVQMSATV